jgi:hypothetical protein
VTLEVGEDPVAPLRPQLVDGSAEDLLVPRTPLGFVA